MKKLLILVIIIVLVAAFVINRNSNPNLIISNLMRKGEIRPGVLVYRIYLFGLIPAAEAVFYPATQELYKGSKANHLKAYAGVLKVFSRFFQASINLDSYVNPSSGNPYFFSQKMSAPGKEAALKEVFYDQQKGVMTLRGEDRAILPDTHDPLSLINKISRMDLSGLKDFEGSINTNQKNYCLRAGVSSKDSSIGGRVIKTYTLKGVVSRRDKDNPYHRSQVTMVLAEGKQNIPVLIKVFASGAFIVVKLVDIK
ncbi:MAG: DUF3108 domain-containing protein [Candidatus Omnitrophica bacterium]|nr:DUF3108 domain-containing protein [Candidatus Omnitrophota bacterium]MBU1869727.1 DUF3108 domain-containing protein [Candidatus Omnitrophota bacterium]